MSVKIQQPTFYLLPLEARSLFQRQTLETAPLKAQFYVSVVLTGRDGDRFTQRTVWGFFWWIIFLLFFLLHFITSLTLEKPTSSSKFGVLLLATHHTNPIISRQPLELFKCKIFTIKMPNIHPWSLTQ